MLIAAPRFFINGMKKSAAILGLLLTAYPGGAATLWSAGVTAEQGWYDIDKAGNGTESGLCWAICASNLIAWWQNNQPANELPADVPMGEEVWQTYRNSFTNEGSDPDEGLRWWFTGKYAPTAPSTGEQCAAVTTDKTGAYYADKGESFFKSILNRGRGAQAAAPLLQQAFYEGFCRGDSFWIGVGYYRRNGLRYTHSLNVWGIDYELNEDNSPRITAIYITDSDDKCRYLHRIPMKVQDGWLKFDCPQHPMYGRIGDITITTYTGMSKCTLHDLPRH